MIYNLKNTTEADNALKYFQYLEDKKCIIEIIKKSGTRTIHQNRYLHLLLSYVSYHTGDTKEYFKEIVLKQIISPEIFRVSYINEKSGEEREYWRSTASLTIDEMVIVVNNLILWSTSQLSIELPTGNDYDGIIFIQNELEKNQKYSI